MGSSVSVLSFPLSDMCSLCQVIILDVRVPSVPVARLCNHRAQINGITWAPHSSCHICTAGGRVCGTRGRRLRGGGALASSLFWNADGGKSVNCTHLLTFMSPSHHYLSPPITTSPLPSPPHLPPLPSLSLPLPFYHTSLPPAPSAPPSPPITTTPPSPPITTSPSHHYHTSFPPASLAPPSPPITTADDCQALIWDIQQMPQAIEVPILAYTAEGEINQVQWSAAPAQVNWIGICYGRCMEILRV